MRRADEDSRASCLARDLLHGFLRRTDEPGAEQEVLGRVAGHRELREDDEVCGVALRLCESLEDQLAVPLEIADDRIDLGECEPHRHCSSSRGCGTSTSFTILKQHQQKSEGRRQK